MGTTVQMNLDDNKQKGWKIVRQEYAKMGDNECLLVEWEIPGEEATRDFVYPINSKASPIRLESAELPKGYEGLDMNSFVWESYNEDISLKKHVIDEYIQSINEEMKYGTGLYIYSPAVRSGKTTLASCIVGDILKKMDISVKFCTSKEFLDIASKKYKGGEWEEKYRSYLNCTLLVLDDIGMEMNHKNKDDELYTLINHRTEKRAITIYTSTVKPEDLQLWPRIVGMIMESTMSVVLPEVSVGLIKAHKRNQAMYKRALTSGNEAS